MYLPSNWTDVFEDPLARNIWLWLFFFGGMVLLFNVPLNVIDENPSLAKVVQVMGGIIPSIHAWGHDSSFPQPTLVYFSYVWVAVPILALIVFVNHPSEARFLNVWESKPKLAPLRALVMLFMAVVFIGVTAIFSVPGTSIVHQSRIAQAIYGGLVGFSNGGLLAVLAWWIKNFKRLHFR